MIDNIQWLTLGVFLVLYMLQATHLLRQTTPASAEEARKKSKQIQLTAKICYGVCMLACVATMLVYRSTLWQYHIANTLLFFVAISASSKAWRAGISMAEKKMGLFVVGVACAGVTSLLVFKLGTKLVL